MKKPSLLRSLTLAGLLTGGLALTACAPDDTRSSPPPADTAPDTQQSPGAGGTMDQGTDSGMGSDSATQPGGAGSSSGAGGTTTP